MAKVVLGQRPKNFTAPARFQFLDGSDGIINVTYTYRTRSEFGAFLDEIYAENGVAKPIEGADDAHLMALAYAAGNEKIAGQILRAAEGWDLDVPFSESSVQQLVDELPAAAAAIMTCYEVAIRDGRRGN